jgi:chemotaxis protein CheD
VIKGILEVSRICVGIAAVKTAGPDDVLVTLGLGSCVAVAIRDEEKRYGSMAHIMLPQKDFGRRRENENMNKYADIAIAAAIRALEERGCQRSTMTAKIAGGAHMFDVGQDDQVDIGRRNVEAVVEILKAWEIPLIAADTGGNQGRTVEFSVHSGEFLVRTVRGGQRHIKTV